MSRISNQLFKTTGLFLSLLAFGAASASAGCVRAGVVSRVNADSGVYIQRLGEPKPVSFWVASPVCDGDIFRTTGASAKITVIRGDGFPHDYTTGVPVTAVRRGKVIVTAEKIFDEFITNVGRFVNTVSRDGADGPFEFVIKPLTDKRAKLAAGHTRLYVRWRGGVGPYDVTLRDANGAVVAKAAEVSGGTTFVSAPAALAQGHWSVMVKDMYDHTITGEFDVDNTRVFKPADQKQHLVEIEAANEAVALASSNPDWALEADQIFAAAPAQSLDRTPVLAAIACLSHGANQPPDCQ